MIRETEKMGETHMFTILIVDDNRADRLGIRGLIDLEQLGIEVAGLAVDGEDGYKQAMQVRPDFILTDVAMPVMDGLKKLTESLLKVHLKERELEKTQSDELLRRRIQESMPVLQEQLIRDLLSGKFENEADIQERMQYLGMKDLQEGCSVLFVQIDNYETLFGNLTAR
jgi:two-component system response regulator YesN